MSDKKIDLEQLRKLSDLEKMETLSPSSLPAQDEPQIVAIIVHVNEANYVPPQVEVRAQIDPTLFTANVPVESLPALESDPKVISFSLARGNKLIE